MNKYIYILLFTISSGFLKAQSDSVPKIDSSKYVKFFKVDNLDQVEELDFEVEDTIPKEFKKKKLKRRVYYGYKTKKAFTKSGYGEHEVVEIFCYLKVWQEPNHYVNDIYWFDTRKMKVTESKKYDKEYSKILHGPYKKMVGGEIVEQGVYYIGTKHGRWVTYDKKHDFDFRTGDRDHKGKDENDEDIIIPGSDTTITYSLLNQKVKYNRGWPKNAQLKYYDAGKTLLKEVIPYNEAGKLTGEYFSYFEDGKVHIHGHYINGNKSGEWVEYHLVHGRLRRLSETVYPDFPIEKNSEGVLEKLWDDKGELIYDRKDKIDKRPKDESK